MSEQVRVDFLAILFVDQLVVPSRSTASPHAVEPGLGWRNQSISARTAGDMLLPAFQHKDNPANSDVHASRTRESAPDDSGGRTVSSVTSARPTPAIAARRRRSQRLWCK